MTLTRTVKTTMPGIRYPSLSLRRNSPGEPEKTSRDEHGFTHAIIIG
jgi:hypothetical protein